MSGWAATNTFRANATHRGPFFNWETGLVPPHDDDCPGCKQDAALALVEAALDAFEEWGYQRRRFIDGETEIVTLRDAEANALAALRAVREGKE